MYACVHTHSQLCIDVNVIFIREISSILIPDFVLQFYVCLISRLNLLDLFNYEPRLIMTDYVPGHL